LATALIGWATAPGPSEPGASRSVLDLAVTEPFSSRWLILLGLMGAPVATGLGWVLAPRAVRARERRDLLGVTLRLAFGTVFFASFEVVAAGFGAAALTEGARISASEVAVGIPAILLLGLIGVIVVGPFALVVTLPAAVLWLVLVRIAARGLRLG
jgi:hypothetical protein